MISFIIPAYNAEKTIEKCIDSILHIQRNDIEVIIINDCSTDNTLSVITKWQQMHNNVIILNNEINHGVGYSVNRGLDIARGEYIVRLDSDDYFFTNSLMFALNKARGQDLIYFNLRVNNGMILFVDAKNKENLCGTTKFMKRSFIGDTRFREIRAEEDWHFFQALLKKNPTEFFTNVLVLHYNWPRVGSLCWLKSNNQLEGFTSEVVE